MASNNSKLDRQLEEAAGSFFKFIGRMIVSLFKGLFRGIKKLNKWPPWVGLGITCILTAGAVVFRSRIMQIDAPVYIRWMIYLCLLCMPIFYLLILGGNQGNSQQKYEQMFKDIGFIGKDGKYPYFCGSMKDGKKEILTFKSIIPLTDWRAAKSRLETAFDCNILNMEYGSSKKLVRITILPADFKIPEMITWNDTYCSMKNGTVTVGQGALDNIAFDLNRVPHVLVAGETGSGKSVILRCILWQMILQGSRVYMIDFKGGVEFGKQYEKYGEVITERERAAEVLEILVQENDARLKLFRDLEVKNLSEYNRKTKQNLCRIGVFSDELAEMLDKKGVSKENRKIYDEIEGKLSMLARLSRATGINLFLGVQRPDATVLTGQIKNNVPVRISGRFADKAASEIVLGNTDAVDLPDIKGRFLYKVGNETIEFQSFYFDDEKMLHDVEVEVGSMLTEARTYTQGRTENIEKRGETKKPESRKNGRNPVRQEKKQEKKPEPQMASWESRDGTPTLSFTPDCYDIEVDDLDLNFEK